MGLNAQLSVAKSLFHSCRFGILAIEDYLFIKDLNRKLKDACDKHQIKMIVETIFEKSKGVRVPVRHQSLNSIFF